AVLINEGQEDDLLPLFKNSVKKLPNNPDTLGLLAAELAYLKDYEQADVYFKRALKNSHIYNDKRHYLHQYATTVLYPTYRAEEAYDLLQDLVGSYPSKASGLNEGFALAKMYMGDYEEAKTYFDKFKANWEGSDEHFPKYRESIIKDFAERDLAINGEDEEKSETKSAPTMVATTSVFADWLTVMPDRRHFLAANGGGAYVKWDVDELSVVDRFDGAILSSDYAKYMTKPVISPDGRYFAYATEFEDDLGSVTMIYDTQERRFSHQLPMIKKTSGMAWSPDGEELVIWNYGRLIKYNLDDEEVVQQGEVKGQDGADTMLWTPNGKYLALLERSSDGSIRIFDADTLEQLHRLEQVSWPHALGASIDGRYIFSADNRSTLHKWDTEKEFAHESVEIPVLGRIIIGHPTKPQIIINDWRGRNNLTLI
ncbi:MAG: PD40 domain-containing protein, partial [Gammaproteobacteria bacterium]|nr:PD40 domain-containing protein [Gammaproteobacteria bacterium]